MISFFVFSLASVAPINGYQIYASTTEVAMDEPLFLNKYLFWDGNNFTSDHLSSEPISPEPNCKYIYEVFYDEIKCFKKTSQRYKFEYPIKVSPYAYGTKDQITTLAVDKPATLKMKIPTDVDLSIADALSLISPVLPPSLNYSKSGTSNIGRSISVKGNGLFFIQFRPICLKVTGIYTYVKTGFFSPRKNITISTSFCIPILHPSGSLDGIFYLGLNHKPMIN
ncbi:hypothetical protein DSO57_1028501 [Entomophthora muscae]|uniref:Uncharacterized protein n=1 Tax=Entomophthora muscae TaxID=34485 RepID=A0ACC2RSF9_9FUNG|nr:hypothetical protein DSO57_1028501 [Entomophthora muscae]